MELKPGHVYLGIYNKINGHPKIPEETFITFFSKDKFKDIWSSTGEEDEWYPHGLEWRQKEYEILVDLGDSKIVNYQIDYVKSAYPEYFI